MTLNDAANLMDLSGHSGRHSGSYHKYVLKKLNDATKGLSGEKYKQAVEQALLELRKELKKNPRIVKGVSE
jgi:hypothetical protein